MKARTHRRTGTVSLTTMVTALTVLTATPASAGSSSTYRITGRSASTEWTQVDGTPIGGPVGNVHVGWLNADETSKDRAAVFGSIEDWDCEEGEVPGWGGHGGEGVVLDEPEPEPEEGFCDWVGFRIIEGYDIPFTMDRKLDTARLVGRLTVYGGGHGGDVVGRPMADVVWTGVGDISSSRYTSRWRSGDTWYSDTYSSTGRAATMSGILGPMGFDPELSSGYLATYRAASRERTK